MMKKIFIFIFAITLLLSSCEKIIGGVMLDTDVLISFMDENSNDLLDSTVDGYYKENQIKVYILTDDNKRKIYNSVGRRVFSIEYREDDQKHYLCLSINEGHSKDNVVFEITALLELNENTTDTIKCEIHKREDNKSSTTFCKKVWYNNKLEWESNTERKITIIK